MCHRGGRAAAVAHYYSAVYKLATWITDHLRLSVGESTVYRIRCGLPMLRTSE